MHISKSTAAVGLANALVKNTEAANAVQEVADELAVAHAVLTVEVAHLAEDGGDVKTLVGRTAKLEKKLSDTAEKMVEVNEALAEQHASFAHLAKAS